MNKEISLLTPCIVSHLVKMSPTTIRVVEMATHTYLKIIVAKDFMDGIPLKARRLSFTPPSKTPLCVLMLQASVALWIS